MPTTRRRRHAEPARIIGTVLQPVSDVHWVPHNLLDANDYNPNHIAPPELALLATSLLADGWTQPIVVRTGEGKRYEIVDGYHRWLLAGRSPIKEMTGGKVPVVCIKAGEADQRMATIRHNRARGAHHVVLMADLVEALVSNGCTEEQVLVGLGMESEELHRLLTKGKMIDRGRADTFGQAWRPIPKQTGGDDEA